MEMSKLLEDNNLCAAGDEALDPDSARPTNGSKGRPL